MEVDWRYSVWAQRLTFRCVSFLFTLLNLNVLSSISSIIFVLSVFLFCFSFSLGRRVYYRLNLFAYFFGSWC